MNSAKKIDAEVQNGVKAMYAKLKFTNLMFVFKWNKNKHTFNMKNMKLHMHSTQQASEKRMRGETPNDGIEIFLDFINKNLGEIKKLLLIFMGLSIVVGSEFIFSECVHKLRRDNRLRPLFVQTTEELTSLLYKIIVIFLLCLVVRLFNICVRLFLFCLYFYVVPLC